MIQVVHLEDNREYSDRVSASLGDGFNCINLSNLRDFLQYPLNGTGLLIADRHLPSCPGERPNDLSWRQALSFVGRHYAEMPVFILSSHPPRRGDVLKHGIYLAGSMAKSDFDESSFRKIVMDCLPGVTSR